jgi:hypothetical protein
MRRVPQAETLRGRNSNNDYITYCTNSPTNGAYDNSNEGTSLAAPFVTGSAALILGYVKNTYPTPQHSEPQDIENLLQFYATGSGTYSTTKGWGLLNIGNVMSHISYPKYKIRHFLGAFDNTNSTLVASNINMTLKYGYETAPFPVNVYVPSFDNNSSLPITYTVDVYRISGTATHTLDPNESIVYAPSQHAWVLNSQSNMFGPYNTSTNELTPEVDVTLSNVTNTSADVEGYTYHFKAASNNPSFTPIWVPLDITNNFGTYAYSLHTDDASINSVKEFTNEFSELRVFPNPSSTETTISFYNSSPQNTQITVYNINGQMIFYKQLNKADGMNSITFDASDIPNGIYSVEMCNSSTTRRQKFIVNH